jgi:hypothetical protein
MNFDFQNLEPYLPLIIVGVVSIIMLLAFRPLIKGAIANAKKKKRQKEVGVKTTAKILDVQDTGITVNNNPYVKVTVEVKGTQVTFTMLMSRLSYLRAGDVIEVLYDPSDPTVIMPA